MQKQLLSVKHETKELGLLKDLHLTSLEVVAARCETLAWLQFASQNISGGYGFHEGKDVQWDVLSQIVTSVSKKHPSVRTGSITDMLSHLVNTSVYESMMDQKIRPKNAPQHLHTTLIHHTGHDIHIPRYPWIHGVELLLDGKSLWRAHDHASDMPLRVRKEVSGIYTTFYLEY
jgi:hypothetical protein